MSRALAYKEDGNRCFQAGDFVSAEAHYSKAIIADRTNPALYTNRAMARMKLNMWESVASDCYACLERSPDSLKAHYYLAQAHLHLDNPQDALEHARKAHQLCVKADDKSLGAITTLEAEVMSMMKRERDRALSSSSSSSSSSGSAEAAGGEDAQASRKEIESEWEHKMEAMRDVFERARPNSEKRRVVPDWVVDDISFGIMVDPVITKNGKSYERASLVEHLRRNPVDPLTREPLQISEIRPNLDLKKACEEFIEENGWAVDW